MRTYIVIRCVNSRNPSIPSSQSGEVLFPFAEIHYSTTFRLGLGLKQHTRGEKNITSINLE